MTEEIVELPVRQQVEPVVGFKTLNLRLRSGSIEMSGMRSSYHGVTERATCSAYPKPGVAHEAPLLTCTCGFYAYDELEHIYSWRREIVGTVEMFGTVINHEKGYRASHQRVTALAVGRPCDQCKEFGDERRVADAFYFNMSGDSYRLCAEHGAMSEKLNAAMRMTLAEMAERLEIEVAWCRG